MISAPSAIMRRACTSASAGSMKRPPSANESGVRLRMPITIGRRSASSRSSGCTASVTLSPDAVRRGARLMAAAWLRRWDAVKRTGQGKTQAAGPEMDDAIRRLSSVLRSIADLQRQLLGVVDPALHPPFRGQEPDQLVRLVGFAHRRGELADVAVLELLDGVDADRLEQFGIVLAHALDAHAVGEVGPAQDGLFVDPDPGGKLLASLGTLG